MKVIHKARQSGKTMELINLASKQGGYIVCHNHTEAYRVLKLAEENGKPILFPLTYDEYLNGSFCSRNIPAFYIDNIELLLSKLSRGVLVKAITINEEKV